MFNFNYLNVLAIFNKIISNVENGNFNIEFKEFKPRLKKKIFEI